MSVCGIFQISNWSNKTAEACKSSFKCFFLWKHCKTIQVNIWKSWKITSLERHYLLGCCVMNREVMLSDNRWFKPYTRIYAKNYGETLTYHYFVPEQCNIPNISLNYQNVLEVIFMYVVSRNEIRNIDIRKSKCLFIGPEHGTINGTLNFLSPYSLSPNPEHGTKNGTLMFFV